MTMGSNTPFRLLCREFGAEVTCGEMAVARKVNQGRRGELALLRTHPDDHPFGAQLAARDPETLAPAADRAEQMGSDFIDLNCACPIDQFVRKGLGAQLLRQPQKLARLVGALRRAVTIPITVKVRAGFHESKLNFLEIGRIAEEEGASAITLHGRTREQRYSRAADWDLVRQLKESLSIPVIGNGDLLTHWEIKDRWESSGCDAVMFARGALIKPWIFREAREGRSIFLTAEERLDLLRRYTELGFEYFGRDEYGLKQVRKFLLWHLDFFCRYRPLPEEEYRTEEYSHPLLQTRLPSEADPFTLEGLLQRSDAPAHERIAAIVLGEADAGEPFPAVPCA
ncbi:MAG: tRNA-dihydrouridine synthase family protein [Planctomycetota bacterium]